MSNKCRYLGVSNSRRWHMPIGQTCMLTCVTDRRMCFYCLERPRFMCIHSLIEHFQTSIDFRSRHVTIRTSPCIVQSGSANVLGQSAIRLLTKQASAGIIATLPATLKLSQCCFTVWVGSPASVAQTHATTSFEQGIVG